MADITITVDHDACTHGWGGCDNYSGAHTCKYRQGHAGRHHCVDCGATTRGEASACDSPFCAGVLAHTSDLETAARLLLDAIAEEGATYPSLVFVAAEALDAVLGGGRPEARP